MYGLKKKNGKRLNLAYGETLSHVTTSIHVALNSVRSEQFLSRAEVLSSCYGNQNIKP